MLRAWQDVIGKWQLLGDELPDDPSPGREYFDRARFALLEGRLDDSLEYFQRAAEVRAHPHDQVGIGDIHLARGRWQLAGRCYDRALATDGADPLAQLGMSQVLVGEGKAETAIAPLEALLAADPGNPVYRYYLASTWCSVAEQCRSQTHDEVLVITSEQQLSICEQAARRILSLDVADEELVRGAHRLLTEVDTGRRWAWAPEGIAVSLTVLAISLGLTMVVAGGALDSVALVIAGVLIGGILLFVIVLRFRRQAWRQRAELVSDSIVKPGV